MADPAVRQAAVMAAEHSAASPIAHSRRVWVLAAAIATILIAAIEGTIIATVMPTIVGEIGGFDLFSWVFTAYLLTQAVSIPIYGRCADLYGRKRVALTAIAIFLVGSVLCGFAQSMAMLIGFRVLQGIGAGGLIPTAQTIVGDLYTPAERARIQGWLSSVWGIGAIIGPLVGAFLVAHTIWPMVFWVNVPIGAVAAIMLIVTLREDIEFRRHRIDYLGSALMAMATTTLMFALVDAARLEAAAFGGLIVLALILFALFLRHELRSPEPMLPLALWRNRIVASGNLAWLGLGGVTMGSTAFLSLYVQGVMGRSALVAGLALAAPSLAWPIGSVIGGRLMLRTSYRTAALTGSLPFIAGSLMMIALDPSRGAIWATTGAALIGIGMGLTNNTFQVAIQSVVAWNQRGVATSALSFCRIMGQAVAAAVFGGILNANLPESVTAGNSDIAARVLDPSLRESLAPEALDAVLQAIARGLHEVYLITGLLIVLVAVTALGLPRGLSPIRPAHGGAPDA